MGLDNLPDDVLQQIFFYCDAEDVESLRMTNQRLFEHVSVYRLFYSKERLHTLDTVLEDDGQIKVKKERFNEEGEKDIKIMGGLMDYHVRSLNPKWIIMHDHDELVNMSQLWWKDRRKINLRNVIDYRRYLPHFDQCRVIILNSSSPKNLTVILNSMETKNLSILSLLGSGKLECNDEDLRKIAKLSHNMTHLVLENMSKTSNISSAALLDLIEMGSFRAYSFIRITISRLPSFDEIIKCARQRQWVIRCFRRNDSTLELEGANRPKFLITEIAYNRFNGNYGMPTTSTAPSSSQ